MAIACPRGDIEIDRCERLRLLLLQCSGTHEGACRKCADQKSLSAKFAPVHRQSPGVAGLTAFARGFGESRSPTLLVSSDFRTLATTVKFGSTTLAISYSSACPMNVDPPRSERP